MIQAAARPAEVNPAKLAMLYKRELQLCGVKQGETIALVSDLGTRSEYIQATFAAARVFPGNFFFSTGPNTQGGGKRITRGHYDVPMRECSVMLDGRTVIERGRIVDPKMVVQRENR